tara:strand:+ start:2119 stop:3750 length:1632 start_codon:yes stop_codon:yes gene_type:complete
MKQGILTLCTVFFGLVGYAAEPPTSSDGNSSSSIPSSTSKDPDGKQLSADNGDATSEMAENAGRKEVVLIPHTGPIRRGHGGHEVYDRSGQSIPRLRLPRESADDGQSPSDTYGLLVGLFDDEQKNKSIGRTESGWSGKGLRIFSDQHKLAQISEPLFDFSPFSPLNTAVEEFREQVLTPLSMTFDPAMAWTYQHATNVRDGYQNARSSLWFGIDGSVVLYDDPDVSSRIVYNMQSAVGAFTPVRPYIGNAVGSPILANNILVSSDFNLYMLYWKQELFDKKVRVMVGKFEDQVFFDANAIAYNPLSQFMYEGFNESITNPFPGYGFGAVVQWKLSDAWDFRVGTINSEATGKSTGFEYLSADHLFSIFQATYKSEFTWGDRIHEGHYRAMVWYNSIGKTSSGKNPWDASGWGLTFNMDQEIWRSLGAFCRVGWGENDVTTSNFAVSAGFSIENFLGRQGDAIGFGASWSKITELGRFQAGYAAVPGGPGEFVPTGNQTFMELYWRVNVTDTVQVSPVLQYITDSASGVGKSWIWGIRSVWSF